MGQLTLLLAVAATVGLGPAGWLTGTACALVTYAVLSTALRRSGRRALGPANTVTLVRATLAGAVAALVADAFGGPAPVAALVTLASVALALDAVDGQVARRTGSTSPLGARFDMETDSFLVLVLSIHLAATLGVWVLVIGAARYLFVAAAWGLPWLRAGLPPSLARKAVAATQGIVLVVASAGVLPAPAASALVGAALAVLCWSFGRDVRWLWRHRHGAAPVGSTDDPLGPGAGADRRSGRSAFAGGSMRAVGRSVRAVLARRPGYSMRNAFARRAVRPERTGLARRSVRAAGRSVRAALARRSVRGAFAGRSVRAALARRGLAARPGATGRSRTGARPAAAPARPVPSLSRTPRPARVSRR